MKKLILSLLGLFITLSVFGQEQLTGKIYRVEEHDMVYLARARGRIVLLCRS